MFQKCNVSEAGNFRDNNLGEGSAFLKQGGRPV